MSSDLATELSALRTLILTAKDDITHIREAYSHDALATFMEGKWSEMGIVRPMYCSLITPRVAAMLISANPP